MRLIGFVGSLAALVASAPLAAQSHRFRTGDVQTSSRIPSTVQDQRRGTNDRIPPGQMPPAGMCRIWIDGVPPGRQPAPTDCQTAVANKPANARVIWGDQTAGRARSNRDRGDEDNQGRTVRGKGRGRGDDDANDDRDDDDRNEDRTGARGAQGTMTNRGDMNDSEFRSQKSKSKKGKRHGDD